MSVYSETLNHEVRSRNARQTELVVRLMRVFRTARLLVSSADRVAHGTYRLNAADILALRSAVASAALVVSENGGS
jgi:hypothetical protein